MLIIPKLTMLARYNSNCDKCGENIKANIDFIEKENKKWIHQKCKKNTGVKNLNKSSISSEKICLGCESGADCDLSHQDNEGNYYENCNLYNSDNDIKNYCFECGEEINITRQLCGKHYCYNSI